MAHGRFWYWYAAVVGLSAIGLLVLPLFEAPYWWAMLGVTLLIIAAGTHLLMLSHPGYRYYVRKPATHVYLIAPVALAAGGALFTQQLLGGRFTILALGTTAVGVAVLIYCQTLVAQPEGPPYPWLSVITNLSVYLSGFLLFVAIQSIGLDQLTSVFLLGGLSGILSLELFREAETPAVRQALYGVLVMLLVAELGWSLQYLPLGKVLTGLLLLLTFYLLSGLIHNHLMERLNRWIALEFVMVTVVGLAVLYGFQSIT